MSDHSGSTDSTHKIKLESKIQRAIWLVGAMPAGNKAPLEVATHFVGDGAEVKIEVRTKSGKTAGSLKGKIGRGQLKGEFAIPDNITEDLYFEAQLPKHGLKERSELLRVLPFRKIVNARWDRKETRRGETVKLQADTKGIPDGAEAKLSIFEKDDAGAHDFVTELSALVEKSKIEAEWEFDYHAETRTIPGKDDSPKGYKPPEYFFHAESDGAWAESGPLRFKDFMAISLKDAGGKPLKDVQYVLHLPDGTTKKGKLDQDGKARVEDVPPGKVGVEFLKGGKH